MLPRGLPLPFPWRLANLLYIPFIWGVGWAVRGDGETKGRFLGGVGHVEMEQEEPTAHSTLWFEGPGWCGIWQGLSSFG